MYSKKKKLENLTPAMNMILAPLVYIKIPIFLKIKNQRICVAKFNILFLPINIILFKLNKSS